MKRTFNIDVIRTDRYQITIDDSIVNESWIENFESFMWNLDEDHPYQDLAEHLAQLRARYGAHQFYEGFGYIPAEGELVTLDEARARADGFSLKVLSEDEELEFELSHEDTY